jgi:hypothetical protein
MSQDLLTQLAEYGAYCDERQGSMSADDVIDVIVPLPMPADPTPPRRGWLVAAAAAALVLIVVGGVTWLTLFEGGVPPAGEPAATTIPQTTVPETTPTTTPETTAPPTTLAAGPIEVTVEWTEVTEGNPPLNGPTERGFGPFIITDGSTQRVAVVSGFDDGPLSLWSSEDGIEWVNTAISLPAEPAWLESTPTGFWLMGGTPSALWYSSDLLSGWEAINLGGLAQEAPYPLTFEEASIQSVASVGDTALVVARYDAVLDWDELLGIEPGSYVEFDYDEESDGVVLLSGRKGSLGLEGTKVPLLRFTPRASAEGLTLVDADTDETAYFFPNEGDLDWRDVVNPGDYPYLGFEISRLLVVTPDGLEETGPWAGSLSGSSTPQAMRILQLNDSVIVETGVGEERGASYLTRDGRTFEAIPPPPQLLGNIRHDPISGYLYSWIVDGWWTGGSDLEHWISTDGANWTTLKTPVVIETWQTERTVLHRLDNAWMIMKEENGTITEISVSVHGEEWRTIDPPPGNNGSLFLSLAWGNRVLIPGEDLNWIGRLDFGGG